MQSKKSDNFKFDNARTTSKLTVDDHHFTNPAALALLEKQLLSACSKVKLLDIFGSQSKITATLI